MINPKELKSISIQRLIKDLNILEPYLKPRLRKINAKTVYRGRVKATFYYDVHPDMPSWFSTTPTEEEMIEIADWCTEAKCGRRTSFDTFEFKNQQEYMLFAMRWQ